MSTGLPLTLAPAAVSGPDEALARLGPVPTPGGEPRPAPGHRAVAWSVASVLLRYPDDELLADLPDVHQALDAVSDRLDAAVLLPLRALVRELAGVPALVAQQQYVATFDHTRRCCPYLTYYLHGDTRRRGAALWRVKASLRACGLEPVHGELPDHLALLCELAAVGDEQVATTLLVEHRQGLLLLGTALRRAGSAYAGAVDAVQALLPPPGDADRRAAAELAASGPPVERVGLAGWTAPFIASPDDRGARR